MTTSPDFDPRPVTLDGRFVRVEPLARRHAPDLAVAGADPAIWRWLSTSPPAPPAEHPAWFERWIDDALSHEGPNQAVGGVAFAIIRRADNRAVGSTRFMAIRPAHRSIEIGWTWLATDAQRTPINTETKLLLLSHALETLGALRVELKTDSRNDKSRAAMERLGCTFEGVLRAHMIRPDSTRRDSAFYSIIADEWPRVRSHIQGLLQRPAS